MPEDPSSAESASALDWDIDTLQDLVRVPNFHDWLDLRVDHVEEGGATIVLPYREELIGNPRIPAIHGGILAGLIDMAGGVAAFTLCKAPTPTIDLRIDYVRPALERDTVAAAEVVNAGSTIAFVDVDVLQLDDEAPSLTDGHSLEDVAEDERELVASGRATYSTKNAKTEAGPEDIPIG